MTLVYENDDSDCIGRQEGNLSYGECGQGNPQITVEKMCNTACDGSDYNSNECLLDGEFCLLFTT